MNTLEMQNRIIIHLDMNAYFASVAEVVHPELKGKPIAIGSDSRRGIVSTASYEARKYGIHSAMPMYKAKQLCKNLVILDVDFETYEKYTYLFIQIIKRYSKVIEMASIDECYVDLSMYSKEEADLIIKKIQYEILNELGLPCSIGVSYCKYLAKIASDIKKPLGITYINQSNLAQIVWKMDVFNLFGIGVKTSEKLKSLGINKVKDLIDPKNYDKVKSVLMNSTDGFIALAKGYDDREVQTENESLKSLGQTSSTSNPSSSKISLNS